MVRQNCQRCLTNGFLIVMTLHIHHHEGSPVDLLR